MLYTINVFVVCVLFTSMCYLKLYVVSHYMLLNIYIACICWMTNQRTERNHEMAALLCRLEVIVSYISYLQGYMSRRVLCITDICFVCAVLFYSTFQSFVL